MTRRLDPVLARLRPLLDRIAEGAVARERDHELPVEPLRDLVDAGLSRLRVPVEQGGEGLSIPELAEVLVELAAADSNLPQILRGHIAFVEDRLQAPPGPERDAWLRRFAAGELVGNAWSEVGSGAIGTAQTKLERRGDRWVLNGRKYYTTGSIFSAWTDVTADRDGEPVTAIVRTDQPGVTISDDWDGFGQQLTGTGTIVFEGAEVDAAHVAPFAERFRYQTALYQLVLLAVLAGVAVAAERDTARAVRERTRVYSHGVASLVRDDAQIQAVVGEISAVAYTARLLVRGVAEAVQAAADTAHDPGSDADVQANVLAEIRSAQAQVVLSESVPRAANRVFDTLGASATSRARGLDRHWRNARTVASHNPVVYKARIVGDWSINGTPPPFVWEIGTVVPAEGERASSEPPPR
ncbi:acyl-CoA dehydrogenase family protein [Clavibacter michiganensis]|uniref:Dibenzothiophene monooxygenase n=1 Tax=Clavibacter michiganensis subsp. insidiosus TaxID=33014 RepID=A0A0D5CE53_9MICO|nr:acyl-CoA dehydrogenase family protein [Clavibacter michiganensis]AJW77886.1 monooxygenase [Clavibacter michiganensis subsp. insidiosus]AWF97048.1 monooxygenase [Clavibacter michiganensis subsp. insidiosus]